MARPHLTPRAKPVRKPLAAVSKGLLPAPALACRVPQCGYRQFLNGYCSLHHGVWGRGCYSARGAEWRTPPRQGGEGVRGRKGQISPAWGAELGIPPRLGCDVPLARACLAPVRVVICDCRQSLLARRSPSPVGDRLLAQQLLLIDDGCQNVAHTSTSGTSTLGTSSSTPGASTSTRRP